MNNRPKKPIPLLDELDFDIILVFSFNKLPQLIINNQ